MNNFNALVSKTVKQQFGKAVKSYAYKRTPVKKKVINVQKKAMP